jgi:hypothetical protein
MSMKNSNDTFGNRTRDLPTCSAVPQPTAPPRATIYIVTSVIYTNIVRPGDGPTEQKHVGDWNKLACPDLFVGSVLFFFFKVSCNIQDTVV